MKLQPLTFDTDQGPVTLLCKHRAEWPPAHSRLTSTPLMLRQAGIIDEAKYQQLQTWQKVCGLQAMEETKCSACPLALCAGAGGELVAYAPGALGPPHRPYFVRAKTGVSH